MATKNIAITDNAYNLLTRYKLPGKSFSDVIVMHFKKKRNLLDYAGIWADVSDKEWKDFEHKVSEVRKGINNSLKNRIEELK